MTSFDPPSWIRHLGFYFFLKKSRNNGNWYRIKPECLWNVQISEFLEFDEENWKKYRIMARKLIFDQTYMKLVVAMETKNDGHTIDISKYPWRVNEQLLKVSSKKERWHVSPLSGPLVNSVLIYKVTKEGEVLALSSSLS